LYPFYQGHSFYVSKFKVRIADFRLPKKGGAGEARAFSLFSDTLAGANRALQSSFYVLNIAGGQAHPSAPGGKRQGIAS
jgi:hypothetical protein